MKAHLNELSEVVALMEQIKALSEKTRDECASIRDSLKVGPLRPSDMDEGEARKSEPPSSGQS